MPSFSRRSVAKALAIGAAALPPIGASRLAEAAETMTSQVDGPVVSVTDQGFGAKGDGSTDDTAAIKRAIDDCFGSPEAPHGSKNAHLNKALYFPPGRYKITSALSLPAVRGGHILGAGRFATQILQTKPGESAFATNGFEYSWVHDFYFEGASGSKATLFDLNWDGAPGAALQSNLFSNLRWSKGGIGIGIGLGGYMGSENTFLNCFGNHCSVACYKTGNFNALQNTIIGGNISHCDIGVWCFKGIVSSIHSVGFQDQETIDIKFENSARDGPTIIGCRTESLNFADVFSALGTSYPVTMIGCSQANKENGTFVKSGKAQLVMINCESDAGLVQATGPRMTILSCRFKRASPFNFGLFDENDFVDIENTQIGSEATWIHKRRIVRHPTLPAGNALTVDGFADVYREFTEGGDVSGRDLEDVLGINKKTAEPTTVTLPSAESRNGRPFTVVDIKGDAGTHNITVNAGASDRIRNATSYSINTDHGSVKLYPRPGGWYYLT